MEPLKITANLVSPIAGEPPMLDSILCYQVTGKRHLTRPNMKCNPVPPFPRIPLYCKEIQGVDVPCCSNPIIRVNTDRHEHYAKRLAVEHSSVLAEQNRLIVSMAGQVFKSYRLPLRTRLCDKVVWFAVGRGRVLRRMLREISAIGVKRSQGFGRVSHWIVENVEHDWSWFADTDHGPLLMRCLPKIQTDAIGWKPHFKAVRWPYWHQENFVEVIEPC